MISSLSSFLWGPALLLLLGFTHIFLTFRLRFVQRYILTALKLSFSRKREGAGEISQFGAMTTSLAATVGTGNIVGVATAVAAGGPGAVLWMWLTGVFGFATKYAEAVLAVKYRVANPDGSFSGGPMYALERGLKCRWLALAFSAFTAFAALGIGNMVQANSIVGLMHETLAAPHWLTGIVLALLTAVVILGGIKSIARVSEVLVPFMVLFYIAGCLYLLLAGWSTLWDSLCLIIGDAFTGHAAIGGFVGAGMREAVRYGVARGLFSNEAGLGSAPIVAAAAQTRNPVRQALVSATGTFWDTVVVCAITGLVLVNSGQWLAGHDGVHLTRAAFAAIPGVGPIVLTIALFTFVFSTILGWCYYGEKAVEYLFGSRAIRPYRVIWVLAVFVGSVSELKTVWDLADIANAMMALPNVLSLLLLSPVIVAETRKYLWNGGLDEE